MSTLPDDATARAAYPMADGLLYYFPAALAEVARVSKIGNDQHNPGEPMHWARGKSTDHANKIMRHLLDAGELDTDGTRHTAKLAWRALALLQEELESAGFPVARNARLPNPGTILPSMSRFTQPPNCSLGVSKSALSQTGVHESIKSNLRGHLELMDGFAANRESTFVQSGTHPMVAEALRMADEQPCNQPRPGEVGN